MPTPANLAEQIARLGNRDSAAAEAAAEIYQLGRSLGDAALDHTCPGWRSDPELAPLLTGSPTVGLVVEPDTFAQIRAAHSWPRLAQVPPDQDAEEFELHFAPGTSLDILTTKAPGTTGAIARFLERFGEGIQQVEYPVTSVDRAVDLLRARFRLQPVYQQTRPGASGTRVNFFLASTSEGTKVLIELVEPSRLG